MDSKTNGMGVAGFVLSLVGAVLCWVPVAGQIILLLGFLLSLTGFIVALFTKKRIGYSIAGLVISVGSIMILYFVVLSMIEKNM